MPRTPVFCDSCANRTSQKSKDQYNGLCPSCYRKGQWVGYDEALQRVDDACFHRIKDLVNNGRWDKGEIKMPNAEQVAHQIAREFDPPGRPWDWILVVMVHAQGLNWGGKEKAHSAASFTSVFDASTIPGYQGPWELSP